MKVCSACGETKALDDFYRRSRSRDGRMSECKPCTIARNEIWRANNPGKHRTRVANWRAENPEAALDIDRQWRANNPIKSRERGYRYTARNPGRSTPSSRAYYKAHPEKANAKRARYDAKKLQATPVWANEFFIAEAYDLAQLRTKATGFKWHVDHIVPLRSKKVCGLHVEFNLQVIPAAENVKKGNRVWPDMPLQEGAQR